MQDHILRATMVIALLLAFGILAVAVGARVADVVRFSQAGVANAQRYEVMLPLINSDRMKTEYPVPPDYVALQGGTSDLIIGAAILVIVIAGGVIYGSRKF